MNISEESTPFLNDGCTNIRYTEYQCLFWKSDLSYH